MRSASLTEGGVCALLEPLAAQGNLLQLDLSANLLDAMRRSQLNALCKAISSNQVITEINLSSNRLGPDGASSTSRLLPGLLRPIYSDAITTLLRCLLGLPAARPLLADGQRQHLLDLARELAPCALAPAQRRARRLALALAGVGPLLGERLLGLGHGLGVAVARDDEAFFS